MSNYKRIFTEDTEGNIEYAGLMTNNESIRIVKDLSEKQTDIIKQKGELKAYSKKLGGYIHMMYVNNSLLFNDLGIDRINISRLIYLATYIDYNDREENVLVSHGENNKLEYLTKKDIREIMGLSDSIFKKFLNDMKNNNLIWEVNNKFYISNEYFNKGKSSFDKRKYTRIFINTTRELYKGCSTRQHKKLSYVFQLIPFLNYETNVLCSNPTEIDKEKLEKLSLKEICKLLGISTDAKSMFRFEHDLYKITITIDDKKYYMFSRVIVKGCNGQNDYFVINPNIIWNGSNVDRVKDTISWLYFKNEKSKA